MAGCLQSRGALSLPSTDFTLETCSHGGAARPLSLKLLCGGLPLAPPRLVHTHTHTHTHTPVYIKMVCHCRRGCEQHRKEQREADSSLSRFPDPLSPHIHLPVLCSREPESLRSKEQPLLPTLPHLLGFILETPNTILSDTRFLICHFHQECVTGIFQHQMLC